MQSLDIYNKSSMISDKDINFVIGSFTIHDTHNKNDIFLNTQIIPYKHEFIANDSYTSTNTNQAHAP